jgi:hypothetical protein
MLRGLPVALLCYENNVGRFLCYTKRHYGFEVVAWYLAALYFVFTRFSECISAL